MLVWRNVRWTESEQSELVKGTETERNRKNVQLRCHMVEEISKMEYSMRCWFPGQYLCQKKEEDS